MQQHQENEQQQQQQQHSPAVALLGSWESALCSNVCLLVGIRPTARRLSSLTCVRVVEQMHGRVSTVSPLGHATCDSPGGVEFGHSYPGGATDRSSSSTAAASSGTGSTGNMSHSPDQTWAEAAERSLAAGAHDDAPMPAEVAGDAHGRAVRVGAGRRGPGPGAESRQSSSRYPLAFDQQGHATSESTHSGSESTPNEQTDQTESDDMLVSTVVLAVCLCCVHASTQCAADLWCARHPCTH